MSSDAVLAIVDYAMIVLFFVGLLGAVLFVLGHYHTGPAPSRHMASFQQQKGRYGFLITLFLFFIILTFITRMQRTQ